MQLSSGTSIRGSLAFATCTLLGTSLQDARADASTDNWRVDSAVLYYAEQDRVTVIEPVFFLRKKTGDDKYFNARLVFDTMSGASANGATATSTAQTFTSPSGTTTYTTPAGKTPTHEFSDERVALALEWERPFGRERQIVYGVNASVESDYRSVGLSTSLLQNFNDKLTTLTTGLSVSFDTVSPDGGVPVPMQLLSVIVTPPPGGDDDGGGGDGGKSKTALDAIVGVTQVLTRRALTQFNYSIGLSSGYLNDAYKVISVVNGSTGVTDPLSYRFEGRPDSRLRQSLYWKYVYHLPQDVVNLSYRYYWDDWGVTAHSVDLHYRFELLGRSYLQPHLRYSAQTAANFYHHSLVEGAPVPAYASADYRLGDLVTTTAGLKLGLPVGKSGEFSLRVESMTQTGDSHPADAIGVQRNFDLFPTINTTIAQISYTSRF
jgi:hypothetical protein